MTPNASIRNLTERILMPKKYERMIAEVKYMKDKGTSDGKIAKFHGCSKKMIRKIKEVPEFEFY